MPIKKLNRVLRQYGSDLKNSDVTQFIKFCKDAAKHKIFAGSTESLTLQFDNIQISGTLAQIENDLTNSPEKDLSKPNSFNFSLNTNSNPRKTLSSTINFPHQLVTFNAQNVTQEEIKDLLENFESVYKKTSEASSDSTKDAIVEYLPGPFRPKKMKALSEKDVFVIMGFDEQYRDAYFVAIEPVLKDLELNPIRVDQIQHNRTVTTEIVNQIESSLFVIADLTGERPNVYYEVGYAHRANKEVILLSKKGTSVHFDIAAINRIEYDDYTELKESLKKRVNSILEELRSE